MAGALLILLLVIVEVFSYFCKDIECDTKRCSATSSCSYTDINDCDTCNAAFTSPHSVPNCGTIEPLN